MHRVPRCQEEDGRVHAARPNGLADVAAVGVRQPDVEHDRVGRSEVQAQCALAVPSGLDDIALGSKSARDDVSQVVIVLDDEDPGAGVGVRGLTWVVAAL